MRFSIKAGTLVGLAGLIYLFYTRTDVISSMIFLIIGTVMAIIIIRSISSIADKEHQLRVHVEKDHVAERPIKDTIQTDIHQNVLSKIGRR